ncbi:hypothetical protein evm_015529 [Chilo suppressalis]|nr:hypothetical protein evm_015529 [Chilo suppressalis]
MGITVGPVISGHLVEAFPDNGFTIIAFIVATMFAINTYLINQLPDNSKDRKHDDNKNQRKEMGVTPKLIDTVRRSIQESVDDLKKVDWAKYWDVFLFKLIIGLCMGMYFSSFAVFLKTEHGVTPKYIGYIVAFKGAVTALCSYFIEHINRLYRNDTHAIQRTFHIFIASTVAFLGMGLAGTLSLYILFVIPLAISNAVSRVTNLEMIVKRGNDEHRGSVIGAAASVRSLSGVVTPLLSGVISEYIGVPECPIQMNPPVFEMPRSIRGIPDRQKRPVQCKAQTPQVWTLLASAERCYEADMMLSPSSDPLRRRESA